MMGLRSIISSVMAWTSASARSGEWEGPRSGVQVHIWSSSMGKRPTWWTRPPYRGTGQALLVEGGDGFCPDVFASSGLDALVGKCAGDGGLEGGLDEVSAGVVLGDDAGGVELVEEVGCAEGPGVGC